MRSSLLIGAVSFLALASAALAADPQADPQAAAPHSVAAPSWTGFYFGAFIGGRSGDIDATACGGGPIGQNCPTNIEMDGLIGGVTGGYDYEFSNGIVVGAFASIPLIPPSATTTTPLFAPGGSSWKIDPDYAVYAGGRVGYSFGAVMPYVLAGASWTRISVTPLPQPTRLAQATHTGAFFGGGMEVRVTDGLSIDGRYVLGLTNAAEYDFCGTPGCRSSYEEAAHNFTLGVNFRF